MFIIEKVEEDRPIATLQGVERGDCFELVEDYKQSPHEKGEAGRVIDTDNDDGAVKVYMFTTNKVTHLSVNITIVRVKVSCEVEDLYRGDKEA